MDSVRHVVVGVSGSIASLAALRFALAQARAVHAPMDAVLAWTPPGEEYGARTPAPPVLVQTWVGLAAERLRIAFDEALGGVPSDVDIRLQVRRGRPGPVLVGSADRPGDLLVMGTGRTGALRRLTGTSVNDYCIRNARCPVVLAPPPLMARVPGRRLRVARGLASPG